MTTTINCNNCPLLKAVETATRINSDQNLNLIKLVDNLQNKICRLKKELELTTSIKPNTERLTISEMESIAFDINTPHKEAVMMQKRLLRIRNKNKNI